MPYQVGKAVVEQVYIEGEELRRLADYAGLPVEDSPHLADCVFEWTKISSGMVNNRGLFYNKVESRWDYWVIGGRCDGFVQGKSRVTRDRSTYGPEHEQLQYNTCLASELPRDSDLSFEVWVTSDGVVA
jgi:hypothetical protein